MKFSMLNKEKFTEKIYKIACNGSMVAVVDGVPKECHETQCKECIFYSLDLNNCNGKIKKWMNSEYIE